MKFYNYIQEDVVADALGIDEPNFDTEYSEEEVTGYLETIERAISKVKQELQTKKNDEWVTGKLRDLLDKKKKWTEHKKDPNKKPKTTVHSPDQEAPSAAPESISETLRSFLTEEKISSKDKRNVIKAINSKKQGTVELTSIDSKVDIKIVGRWLRLTISAKKGSGMFSEVVLMLTDIADTLGYDFNVKNNKFIIDLA